MESKEKLNKLLEEVKKDENVIDKYISSFYAHWNIEKEKDKDMNMNLLKNIYNNFIDYSFKSTNADKFLTSNLANIIDELKATFNNEQKGIYEIFDFLNMEYIKMQEFRAFIFAYCFANEIKKEVTNFKNETISNKELEKLYKSYTDKHTEMTEETKNILEKIHKKEKELKEGLTEEEKKLLEDIINLEHEREDKTNKEAFVNAILLAKKFI